MTTYLGRPLVPSFGPPVARLVLLGEAPGLNEEIYGRPFIGAAGDELARMLAAAGLSIDEARLINVFPIRPEDNDVNGFFTSRADPAACLDLPARNGKYLLAQFLYLVDATRSELSQLRPDLVIALGATALWLTLGQSKISAFAGTLHLPTTARPYAVLPTYHPAAVLRQYSLRSTCVANFIKARDYLAERASAPSPSRPPPLNLTINPTLDQLRRFTRRVLALAPGSPLAVDIETFHGQITVIGFAPGPTEAFCVPFWFPPQASYWPDLESERTAWECVRAILARHDLTYVFQNGPFDTQWLWRGYGIPVLGQIEDPMWAAHALEPELPKGLGPLAATYLQMPEWKTQRAYTTKDEE